jgi:C1A family cysteine protease
LSLTSDNRLAQTPIRNQENRGSCVGFAVAAAHEWMRPGTIRSVEDVLWAAHQVGGDPAVEGTHVEYALRGLAIHQHAHEVAWPYGAPPFPADRPATAQDQDNQASLTNWRAMPSIDLDRVGQEIADGNAVVLTVLVVHDAWPKSGIVDAPPGRKTPGAHAVLAVGTGTSGIDEVALVKNSWGVGWGLDGYGLMSRRYLESYCRTAHVLEPAA